MPKVWLATASGHLVHQLRGRAQLQLWRHAMIRKVHLYLAPDLNDQHFLEDQNSIIGQAFQSQYSQGCISCGMCSHPELTKDHVLTSAYVKIFRTVTRNAINVYKCNEYLIKFFENQSAPKLENMFSMCSELTPRARIPDTRIPQLMQPCLQQSRVSNIFLGL